MPPQQGERLLDLCRGPLGFGAHESAFRFVQADIGGAALQVKRPLPLKTALNARDFPGNAGGQNREDGHACRVHSAASALRSSSVAERVSLPVVQVHKFVDASS
jgi:hypothetical protein